MRLFGRLTADCEQAFHCPAADLTAIRHSWVCTIADGVQDTLARGEGGKADRKAWARAVLSWPETAALCDALKAAGRFSPLAWAMRRRSPVLVARLWKLRENRPELYGKLEAIGQRFSRPAVFDFFAMAWYNDMIFYRFFLSDYASDYAIEREIR